MLVPPSWFWLMISSHKPCPNNYQNPLLCVSMLLEGSWDHIQNYKWSTLLGWENLRKIFWYPLYLTLEELRNAPVLASLKVKDFHMNFAIKPSKTTWRSDKRRQQGEEEGLRREYIRERRDGPLSFVLRDLCPYFSIIYWHFMVFSICS